MVFSPVSDNIWVVNIDLTATIGKNPCGKLGRETLLLGNSTRTHVQWVRWSVVVFRRKFRTYPWDPLVIPRSVEIFLHFTVIHRSSIPDGSFIQSTISRLSAYQLARFRAQIEDICLLHLHIYFTLQLSLYFVCCVLFCHQNSVSLVDFNM